MGEEKIEKSPFDGESVYYEYRCRDCGHKQKVEDIVIDAFLAGAHYKEGQMPELNCIKCNGTLTYVGD